MGHRRSSCSGCCDSHGATRREARARRVRRGGVRRRPTAAVYLVTGKRDLFFLYGESLDHQSGNVSQARSPRRRRSASRSCPTKLVQLFVDPCYDSLCSVSDYAGERDAAAAAHGRRGQPAPLEPAARGAAALARPAPALSARRRVLAFWRPEAWSVGERVRSLRLLREMTIAPAGLVLGYAASTMTGPSHLRYGFARDFLLPALLTAIVGVALVSVGLWTPALASVPRRRLSPEFAFGVLVVRRLGLSSSVTRVRAVQRHPEDREPAARRGRVHGALLGSGVRRVASRRRPLRVARSRSRRRRP